jgi:hypothetical protein
MAHNQPLRPNKRLQPTAFGARDRVHFGAWFWPASHLDLFGRRLKRERSAS